MARNNCVACKSFCFDPGEPDYSELTPGSPASLRCTKNKWPEYDYNPERLSEKEYYRLLQTAETCPEFDERERV